MGRDKKRVLLIAGARPNFMKIAPIFRGARRYSDVECRIVHTGQHYDYEMSQAFFDDLELPQPDFFLNAGSGSHAAQTAKIMVVFEELCGGENPDLVIVVGDVNSTLACSIVAKKLMIRVAHVEAGLRSFDMAMPEEINRMVTDCLADYLFVTEESGTANLLREGKPEERIHFVGNVMIDNLFHQLERFKNNDGKELKSYELKSKLNDYVFLTLHRPSNVDCAESFKEIAGCLNEIAAERPIVFPVHPRTRKSMAEFGIEFADRIHLLQPLGFRESLFWWKDAAVVLTDSGGLQEETTALGVPCVTLRENTERPITIKMGTNRLGGTKAETILAAYRERVAHGAERKAHGAKRGTESEERRRVPPLWDGKASQRIWEVLKKG